MTLSTKIAVKEMHRVYCALKERIQTLEKANNPNDYFLVEEKKALQKKLFDYQKEFESLNHRPVKTVDDWTPVISEYRRYKNLKKSLGVI